LRLSKRIHKYSEKFQGPKHLEGSHLSEDSNVQRRKKKYNPPEGSLISEKLHFPEETEISRSFLKPQEESKLPKCFLASTSFQKLLSNQNIRKRLKVSNRFRKTLVPRKISNFLKITKPQASVSF
jgi:hypothetical protein